MKVEDQRKNSSVRFVNINPGECFEYLDIIYMKIKFSATDVDNCVRMDTGLVSKIENDTICELVDSKLIISKY